MCTVSTALSPERPFWLGVGFALLAAVGFSAKAILVKLACLIDIRQTFELEIEGDIPGACALPLFRFKQLLCHALTEDEQEILDGDIPEVQDMQHFFCLINRLLYTKDCICVLWGMRGDFRWRAATANSNRYSPRKWLCRSQDVLRDALQ